jgi:hypothetical protein
MFGDGGLGKPKKGFTSYSISKTILTDVGRILAAELGDQEVHVIIFKLGPTQPPDEHTDKKAYYDRNLIHVEDPSQGLIRYCQFLLSETSLNMTATEIVYDGGAYIKRL